MRKPINLGCREVIELKPTPPFTFDPSMHKPGHFPSQDTAWVEGCRWQTMFWNKHRLGLKFVNAGAIRKPRIRLEVYSKDPLSSEYLDSLVSEINYRYDFQTDLSHFLKKFKNDKQLGPILKKWPGMRIMSPQSLYEYLVIGIVLQNCTVKRSVNMLQALFENYGTLLQYDKRELYCFWEPKILATVPEQELRDLKIGYRAKSLKRISEPFAKNETDESRLRTAGKQEQRETLINLYGIGPATVGYILFDVFKHYDELDHISPWEQKIYSKLFFDRDPSNPISEKKLLKFFNGRFGDYTMLAVNYIWEDLWWKRKHEQIPWLEKLIRL